MSHEIDGMVAIRRSALEREGDANQFRDGNGERNIWGLALSGGGIRSATFCFGLLHALARRKMLLRFDLLSTVSGGGYIGAMFGRLLQRARHAGDVQAITDALGRGSDSWFAWWLRANGRYLVPLGAKDRTFALAVYLRNVIGIHLELALIGLLGGAALAFIDVSVWSITGWAAGRWWGVIDWAREWIVYLPTPWLLLAALGCVALMLCWAYWAIGWAANEASVLITVSVALLLILGISLFPWLLFNKDWSETWASFLFIRYTLGAIAAVWLPALLLALTAWWIAVGTHGTGMTRRLATERQIDVAQDSARSALTSWLAGVLRLMGVVAVIGVLDRVAWWLAVERESWVVAGYVLAVAAAVLRVVLSPVSGVRHSAGGSRRTMAALSILGRVLTFALFAWWVAVVHRASLTTIFRNDGVEFGRALMPLIVICGCVTGYLLLTGRNIGFLNLSSLHAFYRARLVRSYLGASNPARFGENGDLGAIRSLPTSPEDFDIKSVGEVDPNDDIRMDEYQPHRFGGPIHLINACVNETTDPRGGLFNQDRRGRLVTVGPQAMLRVGRGLWQRMEGMRGLSLGSWMAISGAAVSPGLGSQTRGGISSLIMFAGARLGYWWDSESSTGAEAEWRSPLVKARGVLRETFGIFGGARVRDWFLTDGGHFENTGAYALLAERARVIVVADCGADPSYRFGDIENLVRKARVDLQAEIDFLKPRAPNARPPTGLIDRFGSLNDLTSNDSDACFALAKVTYRSDSAEQDQPPGLPPGAAFTTRPCTEGYLVLVKPNMCSGLPVDLANFKADHPQFPQQGTADQFFDESQWESYFLLGKTLGEMFDTDALLAMLSDVNGLFTRDDGSPVSKSSLRPSDGPRATAVVLPAGRMPARLASTAITSIGFGTAAAAGLAAWQAIDTYKVKADQQAKDERTALKELTDLWAKSGLSSQQNTIETVDSLAATLSRVSDSLCPGNDAGWFNRSPLAVEVLAFTLERCDALDEASKPASCVWLLRAANPYAQGSRASCLMVGKTLGDRILEDDGCTRYWAYDYRFHSVSRCAHRKDPVLTARAPKEADERKAREPIAAIAAVLDPRRRLPKEASDHPDACDDREVTPFVYQTAALESVQTSLKMWSTYGLSIGATQDLRIKAVQLGRSPPPPVPKTTVRYHDGSMECAKALERLIGSEGTWRLEPTLSASTAHNKTLEVYFALPEVPAANSGPLPTIEPSKRRNTMPKQGTEPRAEAGRSSVLGGADTGQPVISAPRSAPSPGPTSAAGGSDDAKWLGGPTAGAPASGGTAPPPPVLPPPVLVLVPSHAAGQPSANCFPMAAACLQRMEPCLPATAQQSSSVKAGAVPPRPKAQSSSGSKADPRARSKRACGSPAGKSAQSS